jgi:hypothetical protein
LLAINASVCRSSSFLRDISNPNISITIFITPCWWYFSL